MRLRFDLPAIAFVLTFGFLANCENGGLPDPSAIQTDDISKASDTGKVSSTKLGCKLSLDSGSEDYGPGDLIRINIEKTGDPERLIFEDDIELAANAQSINIIAPALDMEYVLDVLKGNEASRCELAVIGTDNRQDVDVGDDTTAGTTTGDTDVTGGDTTGGNTGTDDTTGGTTGTTTTGTTTGTTTMGTTTTGTTTNGTTTTGTTTLGTTTGPPPPSYNPSCSIRLPNSFYAGDYIGATITINSDVDFGRIYLPDGMNYAVAVSGQTFQFQVPTGEFTVSAQVTAPDGVTKANCQKRDDGEVKPNDVSGWCMVRGAQYQGGSCNLNCPSNMRVLTHNWFKYDYATSCSSYTYNSNRSAGATVPASTWMGVSAVNLCRLEVTCTAQ